MGQPEAKAAIIFTHSYVWATWTSLEKLKQNNSGHCTKIPMHGSI